MTTKEFVVTDEQEKIFHKRRRELENRFFKGILSPENVNRGLQMLIEGQMTVVLDKDIPALLSDWKNFYNDVFGIKADFSDLQIPKKQSGFDRLIIVVKGMTLQLLYDKCKELFPCWKWTEDNLNEIVESERTAENNHYAIWTKNRVEADKELKNLSADDLKEKNIPGITLEERLIYELKYFEETGKHLDRDNITLCTGSCYSDGHVPSVRWFDGKLRVDWRSPGLRIGRLCSRRVVSI